MSESRKTKRDSLDRSIDIGMDQFGRFAKRRWIWLVLFSVVLWYFFFNMLPQLSAPSPGTVLTYVFQIGFAVMFIIIQFGALFWFLGRPRLYWVMPGETGVSFDDYKGNPEVLEAARRIVLLLRGTDEFKEMGGQAVRGLLLTGDPGTGKSYLAQCMSTEAGVPFAYASAASFQAMFIGMNVLMIKRLYTKARRLAREYGACVVFLDEIDAIGMSRSAAGRGGIAMGMGGGLFGAGGGGMGGLNELLMQMDPPNIETGWFKKILRIVGLYHSRVQNQPVLTVGATNIPESLDPALLRPGRFDRKIHVAPPTDKYRGEVIEYYLNKVKHEPEISIPTLVARMVEYTPVAIKHVINEAVIIAHFDHRDRVTYRDLVEAQDVHEFGLRQLAELTPIERRRLAYHEAGHAVACYYLMDRYFPAFVTIHQHGDLEGAAAFAAWRQTETIVTWSKEDVLARIQVSLASRAAEELFLDVNLNGVTGDFASATELATRYVGIYGMDGTLTSYLPYIGAGGGITGVSKLSERVEAVLQSQFKGVKRLFQEHREAVMAVAESLIERDELVAEEIKQLIDEADAKRVLKTVLADFEIAASNGNGHTNGTTNGYALVGEHSNGNDQLPINAPKTGTEEYFSPGSEKRDITTGEILPKDAGPFFFMGGQIKQGGHPAPGRGQAIAPTMDDHGKALRSIVGATLWSPSRGQHNKEIHIMSVSATKNDISTDKTKQTRPNANWQTFLLWGAVLALVAAAIVMRLYHLGLPFDRDGYDEGVYWQTLRSMSAGNVLYQNIFYSQPPFFMLSTFPGYILFGSSLWSARFAIALVSLSGLLGAFLLGKALSGRLGAIAAMLLLIVDPLYLAQSQTIEAEVSSAAFSLLVVGLAYLWWKHPEGTRGLCYAALTGLTFALSILCKLLSVSVLAPIALLILARLWQISQKQPGTRLTGFFPIMVGIGVAILTFIVFLVPFSGSYQSMIQSAITFHSEAAQVYSTPTTQQDNFAMLQGALTSFLTLTALYGTAAALLRRDWSVIPLIAWLLATLYLLWHQVPLFQHHLVAITPPLIALAVIGISAPSAQNKDISSSLIRTRTATTYITWVALVLILITAILELQQDRLYYRAAVASSVSAMTQLESRVAADLQHATTANQLVVTDAQFIAGLADRSTPSTLVDTSAVRINSGYLTLSQLEGATSQPQVHAVLFFTGRFHLTNVAAFHAWVAQYFHLLHNYGGGRELWVR